MLQYIKKNFIGNKVKTNCVIYGAGNAGKSLINSVDNASNINVIGFIDDDSNLRNTKIENYKILGNYKILKNLKEEYSNLLVLFSIINIDLSRKNFLINQMNNFNIKFKIIPSLNEIINDNLNYKNFRNVSINDLLFRSAVDSNEKFIKEILYKKNILVTGGAGSIGSQIVEEIIESDFSNLVVIDNSEENIFKLIQKNKNKKNFYKLKIHLETIDNISFLENIFKNNKFDLLYHAAAFKHVSIVEQNPFSAIKNNLLSTNILINLSVRFKVGNFVLISTDKAVKPKNYMGLSKRLAEILVQNYSYENLSTVFNIVRFGNVLGSSGSVIKIFQNQINNGGPITVFGKNTTRFFMTIKEACRLVIESTNHGKNGDIIILDMGKPIKIIDLAIKLINLNGLKHTFENINDKNHIKILFTELQKSEKKDEILSYEKNFFYTNNKKIMISSEYKLKKFDVEKFILALKQVIDEKDLVKLQKMIVENKIETKYFNLDFKYNNRKL